MSNSPMAVWSWLRSYGSFVFLGLGLVGVLYAGHIFNLAHQRAKFTVGYLTGYVYQKSGKRYNYRFEVQGTEYEGQSSSDKGMDDRDGARFVVEYDSLDPGTSVGHFDVFVPDSIRQAPANGWTRPPFPVPARLLDRGKEAGEKESK